MKKHMMLILVSLQMQYFVGNQKVVKLTKSQKVINCSSCCKPSEVVALVIVALMYYFQAELSSKTEKIREQAEKTLECFKEIMSTNPKPLAVLMMEEMQRKSSEALEGSGTT